jgi:RNA polymerase sigma-B factor
MRQAIGGSMRHNPESTSEADRNHGNALRDRRDHALIAEYVRTRDPEMRDAVIERFLPLAKSLAGRYRAGREPFDDLLQVAYEGLIKAVDRFDLARGVSFSSYATPVILGTLKHHFRDNAQTIRVPRSLHEEIARVSSIVTDFRGEHGREPTVEDVARLSGLDPNRVLEAMEAGSARTPISLDRPARPTDEAEGPTIAEAIPTIDAGFDLAEAKMAGNAVDLDDRERQALRLRFEEGLTQRQIGDRIGVSQMQVSRLLRRSLSKLLDAVRGETDEAVRSERAA